MMSSKTPSAIKQGDTLWHAGLAGLLLSLLLPFGALAQEPTNRLEGIDVQNLPGQRLQLRLQLSGPAPEPLSFTIDRPARIALDLPDTGLALATRRQQVEIGALRTILAAEAGGRTRVVLNLDTLVPYDTRVEGNSIFVTLAAGPSRLASAPTFGPGSAASAPVTSALPGERAVKSVDFRRGSDGSGRVVVTLTDPKTIVDVREQGNSVIVDFVNTSLPAELRRRMDVLDFATPVSTVDVSQANGNARLVVNAGSPFEQIAYQSDDLFTVELKPFVPTAADLYEEQQQREYTGERLTLNFQDIETRAVLQLLADVSGMNIVVSDTVAGNVTLRLQNVPWDQALDIILETKGLDMRQRDTVILVAPAEELATRERAELEKLRQFEELAPLRSEFIQVNYAKAEELASLIQSSGSQSLLSERGSVAIDDRTNTLLVNDTAEKLADVRRLVRTLDIPVRQVLIESRVVVVNDDFSRELGVRAGYTAIDQNSSDGLISVTGSGVGSDTILSSALDNLSSTGSPFPVTLPGIDDRLAINAPVSNPVGRVALAILDSDYLLDLELAALQAEGRGEIVSTPRVITANQQEARIKQGVEIPFQQASASGATTVQFKEAVLSLIVTPLITPDNRIIMDLEVSKDNVGQNVPTANGGLVPSIDTREVVTQVLVDDGETVVLGGIYETETRDSASKVPVLGDIPVLGGLFRSTQRVDNKSELLIFVTPRILKDGANLN